MCVVLVHTRPTHRDARVGVCAGVQKSSLKITWGGGFQVVFILPFWKPSLLWGPTHPRLVDQVARFCIMFYECATLQGASFGVFFFTVLTPRNVRMGIFFRFLGDFFGGARLTKDLETSHTRAHTHDRLVTFCCRGWSRAPIRRALVVVFCVLLVLWGPFPGW